MMNSQARHTLVGPAFQSKMPLFDGTTAATVLSKPQHMPGFLDKQTLQYSGAYLTYDPRGKDGAGFPPPWSSSKTSLLDGRSPMSHLSGMEGQNHIFYRQDSSSPEERHSHSSSLCHSPVKQGFTLYTKSPEMGSPTAAVRKPRSGGENSSPPSENSVYLAIPKPVYRHTPCCNELGCVIGHRYSVEHGSPRIPNPVYKHDWMQSDALYAERPAVQRKTQEVLLQQRGLQFDPSAEQLKRISVEMYSPSAGRTLPAGIDPNYSGYPCTPTRTLFGSLSEQSQRLQSSPRGYPSQYPSHPPYEHMTSEVYRERSPMSKYGQITHHPVFYYPHANEEVQNSPRCKNMGSKQRDVPVILKHTSSIPREHYIVPQSLNGEIPLPSTETLPSHSFMQGFDYPCYAVPRFNVGTSHIRVPQKRPHASPSFHSNGINLSPTRHHMNHPLTPTANPHKDSPNSSLHGAQSQIHSPYRGVDLTSPTRCRSQLGLSRPMINVNRTFPSLASWHMDPHLLSPGGLKRLMDYSSCEAQATQHPVSTPPWLSQSPSHGADRIQAPVTNSANVRQIIYSPANAAGSKDNAPSSTSGSSVLKGGLKRLISHPSPPVRIKEEGRDLCEVGLMKKRQRVEMENVQAGHKTPSPPMPVIDTVFSLAPYQAYLHVSKVLFPVRSVQSSEHKPDFKAKTSDGDEQRPVVCPVPPKICPDTPKRKPVVETFEQKDIKVEQVDPSYTVEFPVGQKDCIKVTIKQEPEEADSYSDFGHMLVIKKCEPDEPKIEASVADANETSDESKTVELSRSTSSYSDGDASTLKEQVSTLQSKSTTPPQPPEGEATFLKLSKLNFKNIPPQCLKLSSYRIILPDMKHSSPAPPPPEKPETEMIPKQVPVRKRFFELHNSLCKLISKSVSASAEQDLRTWLTQLPLTEPAATSTKVQKVSCLLGARAREVWLNEEMKSALHEVLERLKEYTTQELCPFPHVMRTGAVFLPMLVMKELLFPMVQVSFIDQVLHEHKVALRPTTLSEEKILIQLHKRACSSRLRRLMSLKHLPDIYADVVNLLYYACVCKHLGLDMDDPANGEKDDGSEEAPVFSDISTSPASPPESRPQSNPKDVEMKPDLNPNTTKSRVKSSSRRRFLDNSFSDEEEASDSVKNVIEECKKNLRASQSEASKDRGSDAAVAEPDSSLIPLSPPSENSWMCPLTLDELSLSPTDMETEQHSVLQPAHQSVVPVKAQVRSKTCSGVILKLRRMFSEGLNRKKARYQAVSDSGTLDNPSLPKNQSSEGDERTPQATHKLRRTGGFAHALRPLSSSSKRKHRSLLKIKYCPYLSACHSAEHRRRWVLRSAVHRAQRALRIYYPDLVGKRICHLYEEDDKSEVWYSGEVLRVHEANTNPLKTLFEVRYDSEPEWKYYLELLIDYKKGWLKIDD